MMGSLTNRISYRDILFKIIYTPIRQIKFNLISDMESACGTEHLLKLYSEYD